MTWMMKLGNLGRGRLPGQNIILPKVLGGDLYVAAMGPKEKGWINQLLRAEQVNWDGSQESGWLGLDWQERLEVWKRLGRERTRSSTRERTGKGRKENEEHGLEELWLV